MNFVLVHGAMHGGWCWKNVRSILAKAGYSVLTPTLTGQGERRRELSRQVGVETHIEDVLETLWFEDIDEVHLVLHSYAGILAGQESPESGTEDAPRIWQIISGQWPDQNPRNFAIHLI